MSSVSNEAGAVIAPIFLAIANKFVSAFTTNLGVVSVGMFLGAAVLLTIGEFVEAPSKKKKK